MAHLPCGRLYIVAHILNLKRNAAIRHPRDDSGAAYLPRPLRRLGRALSPTTRISGWSDGTIGEDVHVIIYRQQASLSAISGESFRRIPSRRE